jgi:prepilin-type N-terminal cleavage/methylation domain-containing protein
MRSGSSCVPRSHRGFTLVELLVVIGIIAVLISILLPALNSARRSAVSMKCAANLRQIATAMQMYASENKGWLPGSALTTGLPAYGSNGTNANCRAVSHINDWQAPLAKMLKAVRLPDVESGVCLPGQRRGL